MKLIDKCIGLAATFGMMSILSAQDVPRKVEQAFAQKFPSIEKAEWEKESKSEWEAEFKMRGVAHDALFNEDGTWLETGFGIPLDEIPAKLKMAVESEFPKWNLIEAEKLVTKDGDAYEFELQKDGREMDVTMALNGKVTKKETDDDEEDDDLN